MEAQEEKLEPQELSAEDSNDSRNPVLKQIARLNGEINRMSVRELQARLRYHSLDTRGKKDVLKKRLKTFYKRIQLSTANIKDPNGVNHHYKYLVIIDYEATCDVGQPHTYRQEIIEFPAVLLNTRKKEIVDEFHCYVRPIINPKLTTFCTSLTGITQEVVNKAPFFPEVLNQFEEWLKQHSLSSASNNFVVVSDGPWDMGRFLVEQCKISNVALPDWGRRWINIRKTYSNFYDTKRICLKDMLMRLGMQFEGTPHSGIDDSRNIARITLMLMKDGANLRINERIKEKSGTNMFMVANVSKKEFDDTQGRKKTSRRSHGGGGGPNSHLDDPDSSLDACSDYFRNLDPPISCISDASEFPSLGSTSSKFSSLTIK